MTSKMRPLPATRLTAWTLVAVMLAACLLTTAAGCTSPPTPPDAAGGPGNQPPSGNTLRVITDPPGATVKVDGKDVGRTPVDTVVAPGAPHKVTITSGGLTLEETLQPSAGIPLAVLYLDTVPGVRVLAHYSVSSPTPATDIYLRGERVGETPLELFLGIAQHDNCLLVGHAEGFAPERYYLGPFYTPADYPFEVAIGARPVNGRGGLLEAVPPGAEPPTVSWSPPFRAELTGQAREVLAGPDGLLAVFVEHGLAETVYVVDARPQSVSSGAPAAVRPVVTWRTKELAWNEHSWEYGSLAPVAWLGDRLFFLAPEPPPDGSSPGLLGMGLWAVDAAGKNPRRITWWPHWSHGVLLESSWLTADGKAAVIHTRDRKASYFTVVDLATASERVITAGVPIWEPGGCDIAQTSPDGWSVAWSSSKLNPRPGGEVMVLDLRTGRRQVYRADDEILGDITWSPDSRMLAVAQARDDDSNHWIDHGEDSSTLFPARFVVISDTCAEVAELSIAGEVLYPWPAWSPGSDQVAIMTAVITPVKDDPSQIHRASDHRFYTGPLTGPLSLVHAAGDDGVSPAGAWCHWFGFLPDGRPAFGLTLGDNGCLVQVFEAPGHGAAVLELEGYSPVYAWSRAARARTSPVRAAGLLLRSAHHGLYLLKPDGALAELMPEGQETYVTQLEGDCVVASGMYEGWYVFMLDRVPK